MRWVYVSGVAFLCAVITSILFLIKGQSLLLPGSDKAILYLIILVPLAIASALMLFKVMRSFADYKGKTINHNLELSGPVVVFMMILGLGYYFYTHPPKADHFTLTIRFEDVDQREKLLEGTATVTYRSDVRLMTIHEGKIDYAEVNPGAAIVINPAIAGLELSASDTFHIGDGQNILLVPLKKIAGLDTKKQRLIARFSFVTNDYYNCALNFAEFLATDINRMFNGEQRYYDALVDCLIAYNKSFDTLYAVKDSLIQELGVFMGQKKPAIENLFAEFSDNHVRYFKSFNNMYREDLIDYETTQRIAPGRKTEIIRTATDNGKQAKDWLSNFESHIEDVKRIVLTL